MKSLITKVIAGHRTSVSVEDAFWEGLKEIAKQRHEGLAQLVACASEDVGGCECGGGGRQADHHGVVARPHRGHPQSRHKIATLLRRSNDRLLLRIVAPCAQTQPCRCIGDISVARAVTGACG
jgi:hypothetical protein